MSRYFHSGLLKSDYSQKYYPVPIPHPVFFIDEEDKSEYYTRWGLEIIYWAKMNRYDIFPLMVPIQPVFKNRNMCNEFYDCREDFKIYNNAILYFRRHIYARDFMIFVKKNKNIFNSEVTDIKIYGQPASILTQELKITGKVSSVGNIKYLLPSTYKCNFDLFNKSTYMLTDRRGLEMFLWLRENLQKKIWYDSKSVYFESEQDLSWFALKWGSTNG